MRQTLEERFWTKVDRRGDDECWPWIAAASSSSTYRTRRDPKIYVRMSDCLRLGISTTSKSHGVIVRASRVAFALAGGILLPGFDVHHTCENPMCVNQSHLEAKSPGDHMLAHWGERCARGHLRSENRYSSGRRGCRMCERTDAGRKLMLV